MRCFFLFLVFAFILNTNGTEISPKIYGGSYTNDYASVALIKINTHTCTGVLIGERVVLTAAHCVCDSENDNNILAGQSCQIDDISTGLYNAGDVKIFFSIQGKYLAQKMKTGQHIFSSTLIIAKNMTIMAT